MLEQFTGNVIARVDSILDASVPNVYYVIDNISVVGAMVAARVGIAAVPKLALRLMNTSGLQSVILRSPTATREIGILLRRNRSLSADSAIMTGGSANRTPELPSPGPPIHHQDTPSSSSPNLLGALK